METYQNPSAAKPIRQYKGMLEEIHKEIDLLSEILLPVRNQTPKAEKDVEGYGVELLGELNNIIRRLRMLNEEVKF